MKVTYYNHASMCVQSHKGFQLLTDPWIYGPIYGGSMWQFPICKIDSKKYFKKNALYISHTHPDHYCKNTLKKFSKNIPIYIRKYDSSVPLKRNLKDLGFTNVTEVKHKEKVKIDDDFYITIVHDKNTVDSLIICENNKKTFLMQNDCFLKNNDYKWINKNFNIDLAGVFFMGIGPYPGSFVLPWSQKEEDVAQKKTENFLRAKKTAELLNAKNIFPCSNDMIWYRRPDLTILNGALPYDFKKYMEKNSKKTNVILINSGDTVETKSMKINRSSNSDNFKTKHDQFNEYLRIYYNKKVKKHTDELKKWENSFKFNPNLFRKLFSNYLNYLNKKKRFVQLKNFKVGIRINEKNKSYYFVIDTDKKTKTIKLFSNIAELYKKSNIVIQVRGELISMALKGVYTFEDLYNCNYLIDRFNNEYSNKEGLFWAMMVEFSWYLENQNLIKQKNKLLGKQILTSNL